MPYTVPYLSSSWVWIIPSGCSMLKSLAPDVRRLFADLPAGNGIGDTYFDDHPFLFYLSFVVMGVCTVIARIIYLG